MHGVIIIQYIQHVNYQYYIHIQYSIIIIYINL